MSFPVFVIFGFMGWRNVLVDIGTMMTASVAMGVAVDDTIHFLTWFRRGLDRGMERIEAIMLAYRRVGMAMTQTTADWRTGAVDLRLQHVHSHAAVRHPDADLACARALVGDLIFLPALLASPLGRVFQKRSRQNRASNT